jgi:endonuclease YncB( thermonuclease family)
MFLASTIVSAQCINEIKVVGVIDGDTLRAEMAGMPSPLNRVSIRISGIDTPEMKGQCDSEKEKARAAKNFLSKKLSSTRAVTFGALDWDKYGGRILAEVYFDGQDVGQMMIDSGYATPFRGGKKNSRWCIPSITLP